jgi:hypothetical protein
MKLYTEEQVREAMKEARYSFSTYKDYDKILESITPIELPSDEEIENEALNRHKEFNSFIVRFKFFNEGAKWMRDKIEGGNK